MFLDIFSNDLSKVIREKLEKGDVFVDCGANVGYFSFMAASSVGNKGSVVSIDANSFCTERMRETVSACGYENVNVIESAVGESSGVLKFNIADDPMYSSISNLNNMNWTKNLKTIDVLVEPLSVLLESIHPSPSLPGSRIKLLKIDVEGAEVSVLRGMKAMLDEKLIDHIFIEIHHKQIEDLNEDPADVDQILKEYGYNIEKKFSRAVVLYSR